MHSPAKPLPRGRLVVVPPPGRTSHTSIHQLRTTLCRTALELEQAMDDFDALVQQYSRMPDRDPERMALLLRSWMEGLMRQADHALDGLDRLAREVGEPAGRCTSHGVSLHD